MNLKKKSTVLLSVILFFFLAIACNNTKDADKINTTNWAWMFFNRDFSESHWGEQFSLMKTAGIDGVLLLKRGNNTEIFAKVARLAKESGLLVHAWVPIMNPHGADSLEVLHPDWYQVSKNGESCLDKPPYIPTYKWLCPNNPDVRAYIIKEMGKLAALDYLDGVHLDYIRYPDVILPVGLQPKYDLVQDKEFPEFDFCYCDHCREQFLAQTGKDPLKMDNPAGDQDWLDFRYKSINSLVGQIREKVHQEGKILTAAVFPTPELSKKMVRQDWANWSIDAVMPMMYHQYYNKPLSWVETATLEGTAELPPDIPLYSGLFVSKIKPREFKKAVRFALKGGAKGICLFNANVMTKRKWKALTRALKP